MSACRSCGGEHEAGTARCPRSGMPVGEGPCGGRIDRYEVEALLGQGGMGAVYRARHSVLGTPVALKLLRAELGQTPEVVERFVREAQAVAGLGSPHIVKATDFGVAETGAGAQPFMVMELLEGTDLERTLQTTGPLPVPRVVEIGRQVLAALGAAHAAGVVHRDLKPANVWLGRDGVVKLLDFGVSKVKEKGGAVSTLTRTGVIMGTPQFMAPEQFRGAKDVDGRADLYSAAVTLYQAVAGALPFDATTYETLILQVCTEEPRSLRQVAPHVPKAVAEVIERGMKREVGERWQTAEEFARQLKKAVETVALADTRALAATLPSGARAAAAELRTVRPPEAVAAAGAPPSSSKKWMMALGVLVAVGAGIGMWAARGGGPGAATATVADAAADTAAAADIAADTDTAAAADADAATVAAADAAAAAAADTAADAAADTAADAAAAAAAPRPKPRPVPRADTPVAIVDERVVGQLSVAPLRAAFRAAAEELEACRGASRVQVLLHFHVHTRISLAGPAPDNRGPEKTARCVAQRVKEKASSWPDGVSGIIEVLVTVEPR